MFDVSPVFYENMKSKADVIIDQGGTDSGKTYAIMQLLYLYAVNHKKEWGMEDLVITVVGESIPNLKKGAYRIARSIYDTSPALQQHVVSWNETDRTIYFKSGYMMEFVSYQTEQQAKTGKRQYCFFNEAQAMSWAIFWQVAKRTRKQTFIDYNPSAPFWAHEKLIGTTPAGNDLNATVRLIISDHRHNPFLSAADHRKTENIRDKDLWRVYARGMTGNLTGIIYPNWKMIKNDEFPKDMPFNGGLDFGYTNDPTTAVKKVKMGGNIYFDELCYETGLAAIQISQILKAEKFTKSNIVYCDHDPDMINQLRRHNILAFQAKKGVGSIKAGINHLKQFNVYYTERSVNLHNERSKYMWKKDPLTGKSLNEPIDAFNHVLDSCRYAEWSSVK